MVANLEQIISKKKFFLFIDHHLLDIILAKKYYKFRRMEKKKTKMEQRTQLYKRCNKYCYFVLKR